MKWSLRNLIAHCDSVKAEIAGQWVPCRPEPGPLIWRIRAAWEVLRGRADAFTWPGGQ